MEHWTQTKVSDWLVDLRKNYFFERYPFLNSSRFIPYLRVIIVTCTELREAASIDCSRTAKLQIPRLIETDRFGYFLRWSCSVGDSKTTRVKVLYYLSLISLYCFRFSLLLCFVLLGVETRLKFRIKHTHANTTIYVSQLKLHKLKK